MQDSSEHGQLDKEETLREYFQLVRVLGQGSFGKVYLIRNKYSGKQYALKRYNRYQIEKKGKYKMLIRSIYILQHLDHPTVVKFVNYIISPDETTIYLLFESCKKGSLDQIMPVLHQEPLLIKYILFQLAEALHYINHRNVAHRDIKPSNITFNSQGQLKLIDFDEAVCFDTAFANIMQSTMLEDFGVSHHDVAMTLSSQKNRASKIVGTQLYMSPEMIHSTIGDEKGDLWAYACIIYEFFVNSYLHIEFDCPEKFEEELSFRLEALKKHADPLAYDLFTEIANYNPKERLEIDEVLNHAYFDQMKNQKLREDCNLKFRKILRGNFGILHKTALDMCQMEVIGLRIGQENFEQLKTIILMRNNCHFTFYEMIAGPRYFKLKNLSNKKDKIYLFYDQINSWELTSTEVVLKVNRVGASLPLSSSINILYIKHLYPEMLEKLYELINRIILD